MASNVNLDGYQEDRYFARSWALLTEEPGWAGQIVIMWFAGFIPIVGLLGVGGYIAEWARLTAWNVNASPARSGGTIGGYIKSGWRAFVVWAGWAFCWSIIAGLVLAIPFMGPVVSTLLPVLWLIVGVLINIAVLRATIYQQIGAGYKVSTILKMAENDAAGLLRIILIQFLGGIVAGIIMAVFIVIALIPMSGAIVSTGNDFIAAAQSESELTYHTVSLLTAFFAALLPPVIAGATFSTIFTNMLSIIVSNAVGLWLRQFNLPAWGGSDDPLPEPAQQTYGSSYQSAPAAPGTQPGQQYAAPGQAPYAYGDTDYGQETHGQVGQTYTQPGQSPDAGQGPWQQ